MPAQRGALAGRWAGSWPRCGGRRMMWNVVVVLEMLRTDSIILIENGGGEK